MDELIPLGQRKSDSNEGFLRVQVVDVLDIIQVPLNEDNGQHRPVPDATRQHHHLGGELGPLVDKLLVGFPPRAVSSGLK